MYPQAALLPPGARRVVRRVHREDPGDGKPRFIGSKVVRVLMSRRSPRQVESSVTVLEFVHVDANRHGVHVNQYCCSPQKDNS